MRIAILSPVANNVGSNALARELQSRGHQVSLIEARDSDVTTDLALANLLAHADDFDVVHTFAGHHVLSYVGTMRTVVIACVTQQMISSAPELYRHFHERVHYVAPSAIEGANGLKLAAVIPWDKASDPEVFAAFEELYTRLVAKAARVDRRPWGYYVVLADEPDHKVKRIVVYPGKRLSLQKHRRRAEQWFVLSGEALVTRDEELIRVPAGRSVEIPLGAWHRVQNPATTDLAFIEVQTGDYFGEDDIERKEDDFGRV